MIDCYRDDYGVDFDPRYFPVTPEEYRELTSNGTDVDLSGYYTSGQTDALLAKKADKSELSLKQDVLTAGDNIEIDSAGTISVTGIIDDTTATTESTYSSSKINELIGDISSFDIQVVNELPETGQEHTIYFVPSPDSGLTNVKEEYMWISNQWELIGTTQIDLSDYVTTSDLATALSDYATTSALTSGLAEKQDVLTAGDNIEITSGGTISATDTTYEASDFDIKDLADSTGLRDEWSGKQDALTEGSGIEIDSAGTISVSSEIISGAAAGATALQSVPSEYVTETELSTALSEKQDTLTAGDGISIVDNVISTMNENNFVTVVEDGFYIIDSNNNIGFYVDDDGYHGVNATPSGGDVIELYNTTF